MSTETSVPGITVADFLAVGLTEEDASRAKTPDELARISYWQTQSKKELSVACGMVGMKPDGSYAQMVLKLALIKQLPDDVEVPRPQKRGAEAQFSEKPTLEHLRRDLHAFATERDWHQFHTPRNLVLALVGEVGELAELFQWRGDAQCAPGLPGWSDKDRSHLEEELSDVLLYLVRVSHMCGVDLPKAAASKMAKNAAKYPAHLVRGSSKKYTEYARSTGDGERSPKRHKSAEDDAEDNVNE